MNNFDSLKTIIEEFSPKSQSFGEIHTVNERILISKGPRCSIGNICVVGENKIVCEVIAVKKNDKNDSTDVFLMPMTSFESINVKDKVVLTKKETKIPHVNFLLGRIINSFGEMMDGKEKIESSIKVSLNKDAPDALTRKRINETLETGIAAIDGLLTIGKGQRIGIFAGTGVGKSTLLGMIAKRAKADVNVIALIGERGREVREFIERELGEEGLRKSVLVVSTSDQQPMMNIKAAQLATSIAEEFRDQGKDVLLMMDSVTRFAMARREIDNASGMPTIDGKTPTMEPYMQRLLERAGTNEKGSITGIYTVLIENDDMTGSIPDVARGILDGHIELHRSLAAVNHFPAINVLTSVSRVMQDIVNEEHWEIAREIKKHLAVYEENKEMIDLGFYKEGENMDVDLAKRMNPYIKDFLKQDIKQSFGKEETFEKMKGLR